MKYQRLQTLNQTLKCSLVIFVDGYTFCLRSEIHPVLSSRSTTPGETKLLASEIYELLQASGGAESEPAEEAVSGRRKAQFFLGSSNKRAKTVILHIDGLDDSVSRKLRMMT